MFEKNQIVLPCTHAFCETCIKDWLTRESGCPMCRQEFTKSQMDRQGSFFDIIDVEGKDNVFDDLELKVEMLVNKSMDLILDLPEYNI